MIICLVEASAPRAVSGARHFWGYTFPGLHISGARHFWGYTGSSGKESP